MQGRLRTPEQDDALVLTAAQHVVSRALRALGGSQAGRLDYHTRPPGPERGLHVAAQGLQRFQRLPHCPQQRVLLGRQAALCSGVRVQEGLVQVGTHAAVQVAPEPGDLGQRPLVQDGQRVAAARRQQQAARPRRHVGVTGPPGDCGQPDFLRGQDAEPDMRRAAGAGCAGATRGAAGRRRRGNGKGEGVVQKARRVISHRPCLPGSAP